MKRIALIKDGVVDSVTVIQDNERFEAPKKFIAVESETANVGNLYDGSSFSEPPPKPMEPVALIGYASRFRRDVINLTPLDFDLASPGEDPKVIKILILPECLEDILRLAFIAEKTGKNVKLAFTDRFGGQVNIVELSPQQIEDLHFRVAERAARSLEILASVVEAINSKHITSIADVENPEKASAVKLGSWIR